ncbi:MAG: TetR/AcrR family transcriptional regulator [Actinomycetota bacterium]
MPATAVPLDRRHRRRLETIEEVLDHAVEIMAEEGVAGLSLGEIARRMGIRPPSLYVYFPSKNALYDALFERGWRLVLDDTTSYDEAHPAVEDDLAEILLRSANHFVRWSIENFAYAQLLIWRPVPGFRPSDSAYVPATELYQHTLTRVTHLQQRGLIRGDADTEAVLRDWTVLISGVISQQLSNAPDEAFEKGRFTAALPGLADMFAAHYAAPTPVPARKPTASARRETARRGNASKR